MEIAQLFSLLRQDIFREQFWLYFLQFGKVSKIMSSGIGNSAIWREWIWYLHIDKVSNDVCKGVSFVAFSLMIDALIPLENILDWLSIRWKKLLLSDSLIIFTASKQGKSLMILSSNARSTNKHLKEELSLNIQVQYTSRKHLLIETRHFGKFLIFNLLSWLLTHENSSINQVSMNRMMNRRFLPCNSNQLTGWFHVQVVETWSSDCFKHCVENLPCGIYIILQMPCENAWYKLPCLNW